MCCEFAISFLSTFYVQQRNAAFEMSLPKFRKILLDESQVPADAYFRSTAAKTNVSVLLALTSLSFTEKVCLGLSVSR